MGNKLYVGNLPYSVRDSDLEQAFGQFGADQPCLASTLCQRTPAAKSANTPAVLRPALRSASSMPA